MSMTSPPPGDRLHVVDRPGEDPPCVLMHGFPDDHHIYDRFTPLLSPPAGRHLRFFGYGGPNRERTMASR
jgi:pimeloyl-ACP methyl ester carboxylesterase